MADLIVMKEIEDTVLCLGVDLSTLNLDAICLPLGEDCSIVSDDEVVYQEENLEFESEFGNIIVADNLPVVPREKFEKLKGVEDGLWMPVDLETKKTLGYCFIEYNTP
ncbi:hypothetical protein JHK82_052996 [Glycine max]|nr:hypothetical protein JHK86_052838 [Glycine max]KAG4927211.1 hypothetical protein JHK85_053697 [Glycine max]KAG5082831.1 hypothetical protein JHK84_052869 [Glycine max]KAG5085599.1 hypothetical protein JHK82_052996 [Glycine max]